MKNWYWFCSQSSSYFGSSENQDLCQDGLSYSKKGEYKLQLKDGSCLALHSIVDLYKLLSSFMEDAVPAIFIAVLAFSIPGSYPSASAIGE